MIGFVILHYKNIEETIECLNTLQKLNNQEKIKIVVVDNNTLDNSSEKQLKKYNIDLLKLDKNYGFAKANNKGVKYLHDKYNIDLYCVMNNDLYIYQKDFISKLLKTYKEYKFDMLGPKIDSPTKESVNPFPVLKNKQEIEESIKKGEKLIKIYKSRFLSKLLEIYLNTKYKLKDRIIPENGKNIELKVALHGCCIIFSKKYVNKYNTYVFDNDTFLFHEEEFLYQRVLKDNLISIYNPKIEVYHKEGSSVKKERKSNRASKLFRETERIKSLKILLSKMEE